jgi:phosphatidylserine/phosphatidylglycerophosphate/cardiolipin synthase-like enzyme
MIFRTYRSFQWLAAVTGVIALGLGAEVLAFDREPNPQAAPLAIDASVRVMFTPEEDASGQIIETLRQARKQVLVQAFSFTHEGIAKALIAAHRRGVEVKLLADREQTENLERGRVPELARAGLPVWLDGEHQSAHNKVMVIDVGTPQAAVITGSFNFTHAAQYKNAENVVFISGSEVLAKEYARNWQRHLAHSSPLVLH